MSGISFANPIAQQQLKRVQIHTGLNFSLYILGILFWAFKNLGLPFLIVI